MYSDQGFNIAFIGLNHTAQTACAEYMKRQYSFKRLNMDDALKRFLRTSYWYENWKNISFKQKLSFYDAVYKVDPEIFINYVRGRMELSKKDTVIYDVRYLNEVKALQDMGFTICRVIKPVKDLQVGKYVKNAETGTVGLSIAYDRRFSANHKVEHSINYTTKANVGPLVDDFLTRIGYEI